MEKLAELIDVQASRDESTNVLRALPLDDLSELRSRLFEEAKFLSLSEPSDMLVNRKSTALRPKSFAIVSDILTLALSIQDRTKVPRTLLKNGKRSLQDLNTWRTSERCQREAEASALSHSCQPAPCTQNQEDRLGNYTAPVPLPPAQSIASSVIAKDLQSLKMNVDELQSRMNTLERYSNPALVKNELNQLMYNVLCSRTQQEATGTTTDTSTCQTMHCTTPGQGSRRNQSPVHIAIQNLRIAAWNCRGFPNGLPYIEHLANNHDIVIISEHWLWPFELHKMQNIHPNMTATASADKRLNPECNLTRGCGGIGIIWNSSLNTSSITGIDSDRIIAIKIE